MPLPIESERKEMHNEQHKHEAKPTAEACNSGISENMIFSKQ
jgi:hypothetical protein